jgi:hypothetical protein
MVATAGLSLTLEPMGKVSQNDSSLKPHGQFKPNCPGMIIGRSSTKFSFFYADWKSKMATTAGNRLTLDHMGKMFQKASSLKPLGQLKPNCPGMIIGRSSTKFLFFLPIENSRWPPTQDID